VIDILPFDKAFFPKEKFQKVHKQKDAPDIESTAADREILKDASNYRVLNLTGDVFNEANTSYFHKSVGGYHPAKLRRYQDLIENHIPQEAQTEAQKAMRMDSSAFSSANVLNMLNTKYLIVSPESNGVITNKYALGNVWLVDSLQITKTAKEEIDALRKINPRRTALISASSLEEGAIKKNVYTSTGSIQLSSYAPNKLEYTADLSADAFAVFSEIYYPYGWKASIDEQEVNHVRVDYTLRGLPIPAGKHKITFVFDPDSFKLGKRLSSISSVIILLLFAGVVFVELRNRKREVKA
jgi:uncharacterized membrane protein YfhO